MTGEDPERVKGADFSRRVFDNAAVGMALATTDGAIVRANERLASMLGLPPRQLEGRTLQVLAFAGSASALAEKLQRLAKAGDGSFADTFCFRRQDGEALWAEVTCSLQRNDDGGPLLVVLRDVTEERRLAAHQSVLVQELSHRTKNLLTIVQVLARQLARHAPTTDSFETEFSARLAGLAATHDLLAENQWTGADLAGIAHRQSVAASAPDGKRLRLDGPPILVRPAAAQHLGMALHELAGFSARAGALSAAGGVVRLAWRTAGGRLSAVWSEESAIANPRAPDGFARIVLVDMVAYALAGKAAVDVGPSGLVWTLDAPLATVVRG